MNCPDIRKILIPFLEADLTDSQRAIVVAHLNKCDDCKKEKALLEKTWSMLDGPRVPEVSGSFTRNLMARIHEQGEEKRRYIFVFPKFNIQFGYRVLAPALASVCVLIAVYMLGTNYLPSKRHIDKDSIEDVKIAVSDVVPEQKIKISAADEEIIRNLDAYKNAELYQNYAAINDLDVVENLGAGAM